MGVDTGAYSLAEQIGRLTAKIDNLRNENLRLETENINMRTENEQLRELARKNPDFTSDEIKELRGLLQIFKEFGK